MALPRFFPAWVMAAVAVTGGVQSARAAPMPATVHSRVRARAPRPAPPVSIEWLHRGEELASLEVEWRRLEASVTHRTVLSTFDYNAAWYQWYGGGYGGDALVGVARHEGRLVGIAPLVRRTRRVGRIPLRCIEFAPHEAYAGEFLVDDDAPHVVAAFIDSLAATVPFDVICLNDVDLASERFAPLHESVTRHGLGVDVTNHPNAMVDLSHGYDAYFRARTAHFRQAVRRMARRIDEYGPAAVEGVMLERGLGTIDDTVARMIAVTEASHKLNGARLPDIHRGFLRELAQRFGPRGMLALPILAVGSRDAAFVYGLVERGCFYDITLSYDEAFASLRVGTHLTQRMLQDFAARGVHTVVSHGAHEYKEHWATAFLPSPRLFLFGRTPRAIATRAIRFGMAPVWRRLGALDP
jgi:CelD/BcsL family acetyltransferase involved in cellulose biosynthesis